MNKKILKLWRDRFLSFLYVSKIRLSIIYWLFVFLLLLLLQPLKSHTWIEIRTLGDNALSQRQFSQAKLEYQKLRLLNFNNKEPYQLYDRVYQAQNNILTLKDFYQSRNELSQLTLLNQASADYPDPVIALSNCLELNVQNEGELTIYCLNKTNDIWPNYRDGWLATESLGQKYNQPTIASNAKQKALELDPYVSE